MSTDDIDDINVDDNIDRIKKLAHAISELINDRVELFNEMKVDYRVEFAVAIMALELVVTAVLATANHPEEKLAILSDRVRKHLANTRTATPSN
jgi:hypothetical protein